MWNLVIKYTLIIILLSSLTIRAETINDKCDTHPLCNVNEEIVISSDNIIDLFNIDENSINTEKSTLLQDLHDIKDNESEIIQPLEIPIDDDVLNVSDSTMYEHTDSIDTEISTKNPVESDELIQTEDIKFEKLPKHSAFRDFHILESHEVNSEEEIANIPRYDESLNNYEDTLAEDTFLLEDPTADLFSHEEFGTVLPFNSELILKDLEDFESRAMQQSETTEDQRKPPQTLMSTLVFPPVPRGELYKIQSLNVGDGFFVFSFMGTLLSLIQPAVFPFELAKDAILKRITIPDLVLQSLSVEAGFISALTLGSMLALAAPLGLLVVGCSALVRRCRGAKSGDEADGSDSDVSRTGCGDCRRRGVILVLQAILVLLAAGLAGLFVANEQVFSGAERLPGVLDAALSDASTFLHNSHKQLRFVVSSALDQAVEATSADLDNIESLLGRPVQREIAAETGVDVALDLLVDISMAAQSMSERCVTLQHNTAAIRQVSRTAQERLVELRTQVEALKRQCPGRDRPLCDTLDTSGLEVTLNMDRVMSDLRLAHLRKLRNDSLGALAQQARGEFQFIPHHIEGSTREARMGIKRELESQRSSVTQQLRALDDLTRHLSTKLETLREKTLSAVEGVPEVEQWRWLAGLACAVSVLLIWLLLVTAISCGCCGAEDRAGCTIVTSLVLIGLLSTALWVVALATLVVGGHAEMFLCRPLYEEPEFATLSTLFDKQGMVYGSAKPGLFSNLGYGNDTLDVPIRAVLAECRDNAASYQSFRVSRVFNVERAAEHRAWGGLHAEIARLSVDLRQLQLLSPDLNRQLTSLLDASSVDLATLRAALSGHVTSRDLSSFANQLESVSNQIRDPGTSARLESLVTRTRKVIASNVQPLEQRKEELVYQLTSLEVQLKPLQKQVNQSISHLKTIQYFVTNQGAAIAQEKCRQVAARLVGYVEQFQDHVLEATQNSVAPCRPVWNVFQAARTQLCRHLVDPLNGVWLSLMLTLVLLLAAVPACLKLLTYYRQMKSSSLVNRTSDSQESPPSSVAWQSPKY